MKKFRSRIQKIRQNLEKKELVAGVVTGIIILGVTAWLFYDSLWVTFLMIPYLPFYLEKLSEEKNHKKNMKNASQFKDGMMSISAALAVGYSMENAFREATGELENLYGEDAVMVLEFREITRKINLNENVEDALESMAQRLGLEDAIYFAEVFRFAKRSGGNLMEIIRKTAGNISDKMEVKEEIQVLISGKQMEQKIMNIMPFGIIAYLRIGAYEFIAPIYGNVLGIVAMTVCLAGYLAAKKMADQIVKIQV
ncbi:MAG: type II secretion system F family protein [Lachnospiraceae bacterium]